MARDRIRAEGRRRSLESELRSWAGDAVASSPHESVAARLDVLRALAALPEKDREVLILTAWQELTARRVPAGHARLRGHQGTGTGCRHDRPVVTHPRLVRPHTIVIQIKPAAMPSGSELLFSITSVSGAVQSVGYELIRVGTPVSCQSPPPVNGH